MPLAGLLAGLLATLPAHAVNFTLRDDAASATQPGVMTTGTQTFAGDKTFAGILQTDTSMRVGGSSNGTTFTRWRCFSGTLTPAAVSANTTNRNTFNAATNFIGMNSSDYMFVCPPAGMPDGVGIVGCLGTGSSIFQIIFQNYTAGSLTPVSGTYRLVTFRP